MLSLAVDNQSVEELSRLRDEIPIQQRKELLAERVYLAWRGGRESDIAFLRAQMQPEEKKGLKKLLAIYTVQRMWNKITGNRPNERIRGYVR